jgi:hypothetical protein
VLRHLYSNAHAGTHITTVIVAEEAEDLATNCINFAAPPVKQLHTYVPISTLRQEPLRWPSELSSHALVTHRVLCRTSQHSLLVQVYFSVLARPNLEASTAAFGGSNTKEL